jgi:glutamate N-acetyltransferase / amino-acid N-acetyltransferase
MAMIPKGFLFSGVRCGLKNRRNDVGIILCEDSYPAAGIFTTNQFRASSIDFSRSVLEGRSLRAVIVNSGNANCATGEQGTRDTIRMAQLTSEAFNIEGAIAVASTGIIGQPLDMTKLAKGIAASPKKLGLDPKPFMEAILTTDLVEKWSSLAFGSQNVINPKNPGVEKSEASIYGVCKGSGMIAPNMATMLGFVITDLDLSHLNIQKLLKTACDKSFNRLTVDGDTSTNDMVLLIASGKSGKKPTFDEALDAITRVCVDLAKQIARDGEGATKLLEVRVTGTENPLLIARTIADSPLVKTAMFGCDPNWGRIIAAAGRAGVSLDVSIAKLNIIANGEEFLLFSNGTPTAFEPNRVSTALKAEHVIIDLCFDPAGDTETIYSCDFGYGYVRINAEYHT